MIKKRFVFIIIFLLVLTVSINAVLAQAVSSKDYLKCSKLCTGEKTSQLKECDYYYKDNLVYCRDDYNYCKDFANKDKKELEKCKKSFSSCTRYANDFKKECKIYVMDEFSTCKVECKLQKCPEEYNPVCGLDGITYNNSCFLRKAGVEKNYDGECVSYCYDDSECSDNEYCKMPDGMCSNVIWPMETGSLSSIKCILTNTKDSLGCIPPMGTCMKIPDVCPDVYMPVCGCDGKTYSNSCVMEAAKASKSYDGECKPEKCQQLENNISKKIDDVIKCEKDSDCKIGYLGVPCNFMICAASYNKNADLTLLKSLSKEYISDCQPVLCPMYACLDPTYQNAVCLDGYCQINWSYPISVASNK